MPKKKKVLTQRERMLMRWARTSKKARRETGAMLFEARWEGKTAEERTAEMRKIARLPRNRGLAKCPCGAMTKARADKRNHRCSAPTAA